MKKSPAPKKSSTASAFEAVPSPSGSQADYETFLPAARALSAAEVAPMRADLTLALQNVQVGAAAVLAEKSRLAALPETDATSLASLPRLALATIFANTQIDRSAPPTDLPKLLARGRELRGLLLKNADGLAAAGLLPMAAVDQIRAGRGQLDAARDCVELAALFTKRGAALRGKHPITAAQIKETADVGTELLQLLKPGRARRAPAGASLATDIRDRLWTMLVRRHEALWRAGAYLFGRDAVDTKVPSLQASRGGRSKRPAPAPVATVPAGKTP